MSQERVQCPPDLVPIPLLLALDPRACFDFLVVLDPTGRLAFEGVGVGLLDGSIDGVFVGCTVLGDLDGEEVGTNVSSGLCVPF